MLKEGLFRNIDTTPATPAEFTESSSENVRNLRNLYVLQELHKYLPYVSRDFNRILNHYAEELYSSTSSY